MIRKTEMKDLPIIMEIYDIARQYMINNANPTQWGKNNPTEDLVKNDIINNVSYVYELDGKIHGVFHLSFDEDPTYKIIKGAWKNHEQYGTIHRVASRGEEKGFFNICVEFCKTKISNLRIDTHEHNEAMKHLIVKNGFEYCGIVYMSDGTERLAYSWSK